MVRKNSKLYHNIQQLNYSTKYHKDIENCGYLHHAILVQSKTRFDNMGYSQALNEYISADIGKVERLINAVRQNRQAYTQYIAQLNCLHSEVTPRECVVLDIEYDEFLEIERKLTKSMRLNMIQELNVACVVRYSSPQGRNQYSKTFHFSEKDIASTITERIRYEEYKKTEEYRRKEERSKVTQSLRYDIMRRDGFRCRLCGRSADSGVELEVDHIIPISKGGTSSMDNLQTLCRDCNRGKGAKY